MREYPEVCFVSGSLSHSESLVLGCLHNFTFSFTLVVDAAKVQDAVDYHAVEFLRIIDAQLLAVAAYGVETDEQVAADCVALRVVECYYICVVVVLKIRAKAKLQTGSNPMPSQVI